MRSMIVVIDSGYSRLPAFKDSQDNIQGVLYSRDLLPYIGKANPISNGRNSSVKPISCPIAHD